MDKKTLTGIALTVAAVIAAMYLVNNTPVGTLVSKKA